MKPNWQRTQSQFQRIGIQWNTLYKFCYLWKNKRTGKFSIMEEYLDLMFDRQIQGFQHHAKLIDVGRPESVLEAEKYFK